MNREILFRGKRLDNNEWLYGSHFTDSGEDYIIPQNLLGINDYEEYQVDQNTVGQFTGLCDKNGVKIFENDIVRKRDLTFGLKFDGVVVYNTEIGCFRIHSENDGVTMRMGFEASDVYNDGQCTVPGKYDYEVIGNIYDDPELLSIK